jgi:D-glycero-D-manno-heptose 1,7-bisphosphate phosphatase
LIVSSPRKAVFLDRDGVINEDHGYVGQMERFDIFPWTAQALRILTEKGYLLFIVTNQSGISRGYFTMEDTNRLHEHLREEMKKVGVEFSGIFVSPDHPDQQSETRKPSPKMVLDAANDHQVDLRASYVIGDSPSDLEMGYRAGCKVVLVRTGKGRTTEHQSGVKFDFVFDTLFQAAEAISSAE